MIPTETPSNRTLGPRRGAFASRLIEETSRDIRYGLRSLRRNPGFTAVALLTLALGIGANAAIFSVLYGVLLKPLPYPDPDRLVVMYESSKEDPVMATAYPDYLDWRAQQTVFDSIAARMPAGGVLTGGEPERVIGWWAAASFFQTLGVQPEIGRAFTEAEDTPGAERFMVLGYNLWRRHYGGDPNLIGNAIQYNAQSWTVIGVMPASFDFYGRANIANDFFIPLGQLSSQEYMHDRQSHTVMVVGRLKPKLTLAQASARMKSIAERLDGQYPESNAGNSVALVSFLDDYVADARPALLVIWAAVLLVLLIACANVASLSLARATGRRREIAVRIAIGAGRRRIIRYLLTESLLVSTGGGAAGLLLAAWGLEILRKLNPDSLPRLEEVAIDLHAMGYAAAITLIRSIIFGLAPALQSVNLNLCGVLKEAGMRASAGAGRRRLRSGLVIAEIAMSVTLLIAAGLLLESFWRLLSVDAGFDPHNVLTLRLRLPDAKYPEARQTTGFLKDVMRRVETLPGVNKVSVATGFPLGRANENGYQVEGRPEPGRPADWTTAIGQSVSEGYHEALGIRLLAGRYFAAQDNADAPAVVIVDDYFVQREFPGSSPGGALGHRLRFGGDNQPWRQIVGVARHVRQNSLDEQARPEIYRAWLQGNPKWLAEGTRAMDLIVKSSVEPTSLIADIKREVQSVDKDVPLGNIATLDAKLSSSVAARRLSSQLMGLFAVAALLVSAIGLYGLIAYSVAQRTQEIGIRMAVGAGRGDVLNLVIGEGMKLAVIGVAIGLIAAFALTRWMESLLFGIKATDPVTFVAVSALLGAAAIAASYLPARRATRIDVAAALRAE
jgi:putative ABC transport system permease protein